MLLMIWPFPVLMRKTALARPRAAAVSQSCLQRSFRCPASDLLDAAEDDGGSGSGDVDLKKREELVLNLALRRKYSVDPEALDTHPVVSVHLLFEPREHVAIEALEGGCARQSSPAGKATRS